MKKLSDIGTIKEILGRHGFTFSKSLGQNFLINPSVCPRMAELSGAAQGVGVIEIGPGIGVLTNELCALADKVVAVELDRRLLPVLEETLAEYDNIKVINADVLELDLQKLIPKAKWADAHHWFIWHGRLTCKARKPLCDECVCVELCPFQEKNITK